MSAAARRAGDPPALPFPLPTIAKSATRRARRAAFAWGAGSAAALLAPVLLFFLDPTPLERATILVGPVAGLGMGVEFSRARRLSRAAGVVLRLDEAGIAFGDRWFGWAEVEAMEEIRAEWEVTGLRLRLRRPERRRTFGRWDHQLDFRHLSLPPVVLTERARLLFKRFGRRQG